MNQAISSLSFEIWLEMLPILTCLEAPGGKLKTLFTTKVCFYLKNFLLGILLLT